MNMKIKSCEEEKRPKPLTPKAGLTNDVKKKEIKKK